MFCLTTSALATHCEYTAACGTRALLTSPFEFMTPYAYAWVCQPRHHGEPLVELAVESGIQEASLALTAMLENSGIVSGSDK